MRKTMVSVYVKPLLLAEIKALAAKETRTMSKMIWILAREAMNEREKSNG